VDTGGVATEISEAVAQELKLRRHGLEHGAYASDYAGHVLHWIGVIPSLQVGTMHGTDVHALIDPYWMDSTASGAIGPDFLRQFDVEFDFAAQKMKLFSQDHCPGQVVYWTHDAVASIPIKIDDDGHIGATVTLDGKDIDADIDTGSTFSAMKLGGAWSFFALKPDMPGVTKIESGGVYSYAFKSLTLGEMTFGNPTLHLYDDSYLWHDDMRRRMLFGLHELRKLHLFISYKEKMLYATAAGAH
jgi:predicted aspartyl protease